MKITIEAGVTIINTGISAGTPRNKYGVRGLSWRESFGKYALAVTHNGRKYHIDYFTTIEAAKSIRNEADEAISEGNFEWWFKEYYRRTGKRKSRRKEGLI